MLIKNDIPLQFFKKNYVTVTLQPFEFDPNEKNRHKFMVQSTFAPDGEFNQETLVILIICYLQFIEKSKLIFLQWKENDGKGLMDSKLKCVFVMPEDNSVVNGSVYTTAKGEESAVKSSIQSSPKVTNF